MHVFNAMIKDIMENGRWSGNRTGDPTKKVFGRQMRFNLADGFPLLTCRKIYLKAVIVELLWFIQGLTNSKLLEDQNVNIWRQWGLTDAHLDRTAPYSNTKAKAWMIRKVNELATNEDIAVKSYKQLADQLNIVYPTYRELGYTLGDLGPVYGKQWTDWETLDGRHVNQLAEVEQLLKTKPSSRRIIVSGWNPADLPDESISPQDNVLNDKQALACCHTLFQFFTDEATETERWNWLTLPENAELLGEYLNILGYGIVPVTVPFDVEKHDKVWRNGNEIVYTKESTEKAKVWLDANVPKLRLSMQLYQRSLDFCIGGPTNLASYALLLQMYAHVCGMVLGEFVWGTGDTHIYKSQMDHLVDNPDNPGEQLSPIDLQLSREPRKLPRMIIKRKVDSIFDFTYDDFELVGYDPHPKIAYPAPAV